MRKKKPVYLFLKEPLTATGYLELLRTDGRTCITVMTKDLALQQRKETRAGLYTDDNGRTYVMVVGHRQITEQNISDIISDISKQTKKEWVLKGVYDFSVRHSPRNQRK